MMAKKSVLLPDFALGLRGALLIDEPMSRHTSWRTGGIADFLYTPADKQDLVQFIHQLPSDLALHWVGLGSNLLVRDGGIRGVVLKTSKGLNEIKILSANKLYAESGVSCAKVARISAMNGLTGAEFLAGVPGSFGGALAMNAGAFGGETWDLVESIECINRTGSCRQLSYQEINFGYRSVDLPANSWVVSGLLKLEASSEGYRGRDRIKSLLEKRSSSQPIQSANAGSVFRNPEGDFAARLIEDSGLKGYVCGGAEVSEKHANFIINNGQSTSADIEALIRHIISTVERSSTVKLETEVHIIGEEN
jgi:UDP-N-acetylmuramate dehydrogenase